jgi:anti-sigma factor RsiW
LIRHRGFFPIHSFIQIGKEIEMNCKKILSQLDAYADEELSCKRRRKVEEHLAVCQACRGQLDNLERVGGILDSIDVPPLPEGFAARVMAEARNGKVLTVQEKRPFWPLDWSPFRWFVELSRPMRTAVCSAALLACLLGIFLSEKFSLPDSRQTVVASAETMEGFEWFNATPPASLGGAYLNLTLSSSQDR